MKTVVRTLAVAGLVVATPAVAEDWNPISRSSQYIYMADLATGARATRTVVSAPAEATESASAM